jgi:alkanesulfonate monooxygenase SsuD/methylene tetrahydromethanopterin reductase-like flavin-dependent oxidoreductase (luciferase family)
MEFSVHPMTEEIGEFEVIRTIWQESERLGYAAIWNEDNVYPHEANRDAPIFDCWTTLSALASSTSTIRFGPMVFPAPRRHPALLAKSVATLDVISGGRITVGMGAGDPTTVGMYSQWGLPFPPREDRVPLLEEHIQVQKLLYTEERADFDGRFFQLEDAVCSPKPVQESGPPIWIGLNRRVEAMAQLAAERADGIVIEWGDDAVAAKVVPALERACEEAGRDSSELAKARFCFALVTDGSWSREDALRELARAGGFFDENEISDLAEMWLGVLFGTPDEIREQIAARVEGLGFDHLMCHFYSLGLDNGNAGIEGFHGNVLAGIRAFAEQVMPRFDAKRV